MKHRKSYVKKLHNQAQAKPVRVTTETPRVVGKMLTTERKDFSPQSTQRTQSHGEGVKGIDIQRWEMRAVWGMSGVLVLAILAICEVM